MFGNEGAAGLSFQLSMYRLLDDLDDARQSSRESVLYSRLSQLGDDYNRLLTHAQAIERNLQQRNTQLATTRADLTGAQQQLATTQQELERSRAEVAYLHQEAYRTMTIQQELAKERERQRDLRSQSE